jgi:hypothetical protein
MFNYKHLSGRTIEQSARVKSENFNLQHQPHGVQIHTIGAVIVWTTFKLYKCHLALLLLLLKLKLPIHFKCNLTALVTGK